MEKEYTRSLFVSANEANPEGELAVTALVAELIEIATAHANALGIGNPVMEHLDAGWVLSRLTIEMTSYPKVNKEVVISTWVEGWNRHFSTRDFCISSPEGEVYGYARSVWLVLNMRTHDNYGLSHLSLPDDIVSDRPCPIEPQKRHQPIRPAGEYDVSTPAQRALPATAPTQKYTFKYNDIDFYRHVNTVRYVAVLINQFSLHEFDRNFIGRFELSFLHEGQYGQTVLINRYDEDNTASFTLTPEGSENAIIFARLRLAPRS